MNGDLSSNAARQAYCQNTVNANGDTCNYTYGSCVDFSYPSPLTNCN